MPAQRRTQQLYGRQTWFSHMTKPSTVLMQLAIHHHHLCIKSQKKTDFFPPHNWGESAALLVFSRFTHSLTTKKCWLGHYASSRLQTSCSFKHWGFLHGGVWGFTRTDDSSYAGQIIQQENKKLNILCKMHTEMHILPSILKYRTDKAKIGETEVYTKCLPTIFLISTAASKSKRRN